jgi:hypothetical protein
MNFSSRMPMVSKAYLRWLKEDLRFLPDIRRDGPMSSMIYSTVDFDKMALADWISACLEVEGAPELLHDRVDPLDLLAQRVDVRAQ